MADYRSLSNEELLQALEQAGRTPDPKLIAACLGRGDELVPGLLDLFAACQHEDSNHHEWAPDDPRCYGIVHSSRLLMAQQVTDALPVLHRYFRDEDIGDWLSEWFEGEEMANFGLEAVPELRAILADAEVNLYARWTAANSLGALASTYPLVRGEVLEALHEVLPDYDDGTLDVPEEPDEDDLVLWTVVLLALAYLGDETARPVAHALHEAEFVDEMMYGDVEDFDRILGSDADEDTFDEVGDYDIVVEYRRRKSSELAEQRRKEQYAQRQAQAKVDDGKIGRNDRVTIRNPTTDEVVEGIKFKHAQKKLAAGWIIVEV